MRIVRESDTTERFTKAIDQLGTYKLEVQLGGIFALEKIAWDSVQNHWMIMEILTAYVRENAKWNEAENVKSQNGTAKANNKTPNNNTSYSSKAPTDIQAILGVLGRRRWLDYEMEQMKILNLRKSNLANLNLRRLFLERVNFRGASFVKANLTEAKLSNAFFGEANLTGANLLKADLRGASLIDADLTGANLKEADLSSANLINAKLASACLADAQLDSANLSQANLSGSDISGVSLINVNLSNTKLQGVKYDYNTIFPDWITQDLKEELRMSFKN